MAGSLGPRSTDDSFDEVHEINVTPFIDVMLVLLIIFMIAAPLATVDVAVDLPRSTAAPQPRPPDPIYLTLRDDLSLALGEDPVTREALSAGARRGGGGRQGGADLPARRRAGAYGELMQVMDLMRAAGHLKVALVALEGGEALPETPVEAGQ